MIYLDNHASTQTDARVLDIMVHTMKHTYGNPHSTDHMFGWNAQDAIETARQQVAQSVGAKPVSVVFTSGATESNNIMIQGFQHPQNRKTILVSEIEHPCILESVRLMQNRGYNVKYIPVDAVGRIKMDIYEQMLDDTVALVSVMAVNNVIGVIQDIISIGEKAHTVGAFFHTDIAQGLGKVSIDMQSMPIDALTISGHKIYGPMGIGALIVKKGLQITPLIVGGGQEKGIRSGTAAVELIAGLGEACRITSKEATTENERIKALRDTFVNTVLAKLPQDRVRILSDVTISGSIPLYVKGIEKSAVFSKLQHIAISSGSACSSKGGKSSSVLQAIGIHPSETGTLLRICIGRFTTKKDIEIAIKDITQALAGII